MKNDKSTITKELDHIRNSINQKNETQSKDDNFILLDKIVSKGKKYNQKAIIENKLNNKAVEQKNNDIIQNKKVKIESKSNKPKKNIVNNISNPLKKTKDPVEALVDREIKPIIKKWIGKNLKSFVKTIVIQEIKLISKATQKHK
jgi:cell pole-organizing protein PopZ